MNERVKGGSDQGRAEDPSRRDGLPVAPPAQPDGRAGRCVRVILVRRELVAGAVDLEELYDRCACAPIIHDGCQSAARVRPQGDTPIL